MKKGITKVLLSACLLGHKVRYDGKDNLNSHPRLQAWIKAGLTLSICPEMAAGLATPRAPAEIQGFGSGLAVLNNTAKVITCGGEDVTASYVTGANRVLLLAQQHQVKVAILKARSPSCGSIKVYDGGFSGVKIPGMGVTAALLKKHGIQVFNEFHIDEALDAAEII